MVGYLWKKLKDLTTANFGLVEICPACLLFQQLMCLVKLLCLKQLVDGERRPFGLIKCFLITRHCILAISPPFSSLL